MKNIWFISHATMPPHMAVRTRTNSLTKYLVKKGYNVEIFSSSTIHNTNINLIEDKKTLYIQKEYDGVVYNNIRTSNYSGNGFSRIINLLQFPLRLYKVAKEKDNKPDVIICNPQSIFGVIPYMISKKYNSKFITEVRDLWPEAIVEIMGYSRKNPIIMLLYYFEKWIYKKSNRIIFTMEGGRDYLIDKRLDKEVSLEKVYHITNGVDLDEFQYNKSNYFIDKDLLENKNKFKVIYTGSIRIANNVSLLVKSAKIIQEEGYKDIQIIIYGEGSDRKTLESYCRDNNINNVYFRGHVDKKYVPYILSKSDLNILVCKQSKTWKYGGSLNKLSEYMASGKPILSTFDMSYNQITKYNCGKVCNSDDPSILAKDIISFYNLPSEKYKEFRENALNSLKYIDYKVLADKYENIVTNL